MDEDLWSVCVRHWGEMRRLRGFILRYDIPSYERLEWVQETLSEFLEDFWHLIFLERLANAIPQPLEPYSLMGPAIRDDIETLLYGLMHLLDDMIIPRPGRL
jgi:hypothetical protein